MILRSFVLAFATLGMAAAAHAATITVSFSEDFAEKLEEDYGTREGPVLTDDIIEDLERALSNAGLDAERIEVTILDAKPNRPTFEQAAARPGLDMLRSVSIGGMALSATVHHSDGRVSEISYDWFENDIRDSAGKPTWWDANRASGRFATRVVETLKAGAN